MLHVAISAEHEVETHVPQALDANPEVTSLPPSPFDGVEEQRNATATTNHKPTPAIFFAVCMTPLFLFPRSTYRDRSEE